MAFYKVTGIKWEKCGYRVNLPKEVIYNCESKEEAIDIASEHYGFSIKSYESIVEIPEMLNFEVETEYKSGRKRTEIICAESEEEMWKIYDARHDKNKVKSSTIYDVNMA